MNDNISYDVRIHKIFKDKNAKRRPYRVRWTVGKQPRFSQYHATNGLAKSFLSKLTTAAKEGEPFDAETGLPVSMLRAQQAKEAAQNGVTWLEHARSYAAYKWPKVAGKSRKGMAEILRDVTVAVLPEPKKHEWYPDRKTLSEALRLWAFIPGRLDETPDDSVPTDILDALGWAEENSPAFADVVRLDNVRRLLDGLARTQAGRPAAANYFHRRRTVLYNVFRYGVTEGHIDTNPLDAPNLNWEKPSDLQSDDVVDPRSVGNRDQVESMLTAVSYVGEKIGPRYVAFFACMYYAMMRPEEVINLRKSHCELPAQGWGRLVLEGSSPNPGRQWTDNGQAHELRGLKHRGRRSTRSVPIQPRLVALLRDHIQLFGVGKEGRLFRTLRGNPIGTSAYNKVWRAAHDYGLNMEDRDTPRLQRPYDLRHSGVSLRRTAGVPSKQVAEWAGHSVEVLERIYSKVLEGYDDRWQKQIDDFMNG